MVLLFAFINSQSISLQSEEKVLVMVEAAKDHGHGAAVISVQRQLTRTAVLAVTSQPTPHQEFSAAAGTYLCGSTLA